MHHDATDVRPEAEATSYRCTSGPCSIEPRPSKPPRLVHICSPSRIRVLSKCEIRVRVQDQGSRGASYRMVSATYNCCARVTLSLYCRQSRHFDPIPRNLPCCRSYVRKIAKFARMSVSAQAIWHSLTIQTEEHQWLRVATKRVKPTSPDHSDEENTNKEDVFLCNSARLVAARVLPSRPLSAPFTTSTLSYTGPPRQFNHRSTSFVVIESPN